MKIVFTSDVHAHLHRVGSCDGRGQDRLADGLSALDQTLAFARTHDATWVFGGDMKIPKSIWSVEALNGVLATLKRYGDVRKIAIPGNHDTVSGSFGSGLEPLREHVQVFDRAFVGRLLGSQAPMTFAAWPWGARHRDALPVFLDEAVAARKRGETVVLLAHLMFEGMLPQADRAHPGKSLPPQAFRPGDAFDVALVGDVHHGQGWDGTRWTPYDAVVRGGSLRVRKSLQRAKVAPGCDLVMGAAIPLRAPGPWRGEVFYPGSPYAQSFGEKNDYSKGCLLVDLATGEVQLLRVNAPRFVEIEVTQ